MRVASSRIASSEYLTPLRLDWKFVFADLAQYGCSGYRVAMLIGEPWSTVQRWCSGVEPRYGCGHAIIELHTRYCGLEKTLARLRDGGAVV